MKSTHWLSTLCALTIALAACNSEPKKTAGTSEAKPAELPAPPPAAKPEIYLYATVYDAMLLREQPDQKAKIVEKLPFGEFLEGTGEQSANKVEANLGGVTWTEPFVKATHATPDQKSGWIFGGGVQAVYAGPRSTAPDLGKLTQFTMLLKTLNVKKLESGAKAWAFVKANFADAKGTTADAAFILLERHLRRMEHEGNFYKLTESMADKFTPEQYDAVFNGTFDMGKTPMLKNIEAAGFRLATSEGMIFPVVDWRQLGAFFAEKVTPVTKNFIAQSTAESMKPEQSDGGIVIPLEEVADRAAFWEKFNADHPYFVLSDVTREHEHWGQLSLLAGANNSPAFDYGDVPTVNEDFKKVWAYTVQKYPDTKLGKAVKAFADLVAAEGGKRTPKVEAALKAAFDRYEATH